MSLATALLTPILGDASPWTPRRLFQLGEAGGVYDPSDLTAEKVAWALANPGFTSAQFLAAFPTHGLYQDAAGTTPVTALGQPVGLVIDSKTGGLASIGATVLANGDFASGASWTAGTGWSIAAGVATKTAGTASVLSQAVTLTIPGTYRLIYTMTRSAGTLTPRITGGTTVNATARSASGTYTEYVTTVTGNTTFEFSADASFAGTVDDVTLQLVPGVHAIQATNSSRPLLDGRVNLLTFSEQFDNAAWVKSSTTVSANAAIAPDGTTTADLVYPASSGSFRSIYQTFTGVNNQQSFYAKASGISWVALIDHTGLANCAWFNIAAGTVGTVAAGYTATIEAAPNGYFRCTAVRVSGNFLGLIQITPTNGDAINTVTASGTNGVLLWGADARLAADAAYPYQRVAAATDYADVGVPRSFAFDGFDDSLYTASNMDLSGTDKVTVLAGVRKFVDVFSIVAETSADATSNNGAFILCPGSVNFASFGSRGNATYRQANSASGSWGTPGTVVLTGIADISAPQSSVRVNGVQSNNLLSQGTGNYGSYVLFIGRRNNASLPLNGKAYQLIVRGALTDAATLAQAERYVGAKTGIFL